MTTAPLVDIKRFAVHDGPGIRTTLFLKGCPLHCRWCHNPESIRPQPELGVSPKQCTACGECAKICPCHTVANGEHRIDRTRCTGCGTCTTACLFDALTHYGRPISVDHAARLILEDRDFYRDSGGGATMSGGEPLLHPEFCAALFGRLRKEGIHTAIDTCGNVPWTAFENVLPQTDLFLYDFKHAHSGMHRALTGCGNELILENLRKLSQTGKPVEIRMIMIPTLNMAENELIAAAKILVRLPHVTGIKLLPYHAFAATKYDAIGHRCTLPATPSPTPGQMAAAAAILNANGVSVIA